MSWPTFDLSSDSFPIFSRGHFYVYNGHRYLAEADMFVDALRKSGLKGSGGERERGWPLHALKIASKPTTNHKSMGARPHVEDRFPSSLSIFGATAGKGHRQKIRHEFKWVPEKRACIPFCFYLLPSEIMDIYSCVRTKLGCQGSSIQIQVGREGRLWRSQRQMRNPLAQNPGRKRRRDNPNHR